MRNDDETETPSKGDHRRMPSDEISRWPPDEISIAAEDRVDDHWSNYSHEEAIISVEENRITDPWSAYMQEDEISVEENRISDPWSSYIQEDDFSRQAKRTTDPWPNYELEQDELVIGGHPGERGRKAMVVEEVGKPLDQDMKHRRWPHPPLIGLKRVSRNGQVDVLS